MLTTHSPQVIMEPNETYCDPARTPRVRIVYDNALSKAEAITAVTQGVVEMVLDLTIAEVRAFEGHGRASVHAKPAKTVLLLAPPDWQGIAEAAVGC